MGIVVLLILFTVATFPILIIPILISGAVFFIWVTSQDKKLKARRKAEYELKWNAEAVFERRVKHALIYEGRKWTRNTSIEVGAKKFVGNSYVGIIKTVNGLELWHCIHAHEKAFRKSRKYSFQSNPSITAARSCAQKELTKNYAKYVELGKTKKTGIRHKRSRLENSFYEPIYDTLKTFNFCCAYCGISGLTKDSTHKDHVVPIHVGGENSSENMLPVCSNCNLAKGTKSVFQFLLELESKNGVLPPWILNSPTWQSFRYKKLDE
jgi:5-methylcytosine-specific restriction endonuclease McrA